MSGMFYATDLTVFSCPSQNIVLSDSNIAFDTNIMIVHEPQAPDWVVDLQPPRNSKVPFASCSDAQ